MKLEQKIEEVMWTIHQRNTAENANRAADIASNFDGLPNGSVLAILLLMTLVHMRMAPEEFHEPMFIAFTRMLRSGLDSLSSE